MAGSGKKAARGREFPISPCLCAASLPVPLGLPRASTVGITAPELLSGLLGLWVPSVTLMQPHGAHTAAGTQRARTALHPSAPHPVRTLWYIPEGQNTQSSCVSAGAVWLQRAPSCTEPIPPAHTGPCSLLHHCLPDGVPLQELRCSAGPGKQQHRMAHSAHRETPRPGDGGTDRPGQLSVSIQARQ